jgi:hypothetical protein
VCFLIYTNAVGHDGPPHTSFKLWLNQLSVLLDRNLWGRVYTLFNIHPNNKTIEQNGDQQPKVDLSALPAKAKAAKDKLKSKMLKQYTWDEWYQSAEGSIDMLVCCLLLLFVVVCCCCFYCCCLLIWFVPGFRSNCTTR